MKRGNQNRPARGYIFVGQTSGVVGKASGNRIKGYTVMVRQRRFIFSSTLVVGLVLVMLIPFAVQGADQFASPEFEQQWNSVEGTIPNFWGPLATARDGQPEQYAEGVYNGEPGKRLVQYFDKARMEKTNPARPVTNGLLTVELKTGALQLGDFSFEQRNAATIEIAGDQDAPGPSYATLNALMERVAQRGGAVDRGYDGASKTFVNVPPASDPELAFVTYQGDPGGRFGQNVPKAFWDYLQTIPGGWLTTMGYPISEAFGAQVLVNGQSTFVVVQAFERRVLTYTPTNQARFRVEFGNIGRHYYRWRYEQSHPVTATATLTVTPNPSPRAGRVTINGTGFAANGKILLQFISQSEGTTTAVTPTPVSATGTFTLAEDLGQEAFNDASLTVNILDASSRMVLATVTVALTGPRV